MKVARPKSGALRFDRVSPQRSCP